MGYASHRSPSRRNSIVNELSHSESISQFGKYLLDGEIARGGMSRVYRARLRGPGGFEKKLVVKQILPALAQDPDFIRLFVEEANNLVQMGHPHIVPVYELGMVEGVYYLAMELVQGATVAEILEHGPLEEALCVHIGVQVTEALRYAHERFSLVHRDVTPRNVMIDAEGHARLLDFGIAAPVESTGRGGVFGSPGYMSPEQTRGEVLGAQSDLFSLGTVLYEALTGRRAIERISESGVVDDAPRRLDEDDGVSPPIAELVNRLLSTDPDVRPATAREVARSLRTWLAERHPQGVAAELGTRAEQARQARMARRMARTEGHGSGSQPPKTPSVAPGLTRSIAKSPALDDIVSQVTEPLPRRAPAPDCAPAPAPRVSRVVSLGAGLGVVAALGLVVALIVRASDGPPAPPASSVSSAPRPVPEASAPAPARGATRAASEPQPAPSLAELLVESREGALSAAPAKAPAVVATGHVTVNATPWASLTLDGRAIGNTPRRKLGLRAGKHTLLLECPPLGRSHNLPFELAAGEHKRILVDLTAEPPHVSER